MNFINPFMLAGVAAVTIPIAIHFFFRSRYRTVPWAAMKFLLTSIEQTSRRLRFQELLLLLLRCAVVALLALALARPLSSSVAGSSGRGEAVDAVLVFDNSCSMAAREGTEPRFERAKKAALDIIDKLPIHSTVQVITCADRSALLGPRNPANLDQARDLITGLQLTSLASDLVPGIQEAQAVLKRGQLPNREMYLFSDMQLLGWEQQAETLNKTFREIGQQAGVFLVRCGTRKLANAAIVEITPQAGVPRPGERIGFAVLVRNTGDEGLKDLEVGLTVNGKNEERETQYIKELPPGKTRAVLLTGKMGPPGLHVISATLKQDDLDADNRLDQVLLVRDQVQVLVVDGAPNQQEAERSASFFLRNALTLLANKALQAEVVTARQVTPAMLANKALCILTNVALEADRRRRVEVPSAEFLDELNRFVRTGHGLMIFAGENVTPEGYNKELGEKRQLLPYRLKGLAEYPETAPIALARESAHLPGFRRLKEDEYFKGINGVLTWLHLEIGDGSRGKKKGKETTTAPTEGDAGEGNLSSTETVLAYVNGKPAILTSRVDGGEVMLFTTAAHPGTKAGVAGPTWTFLPLLPSFLPLMEMSLNHLLSAQTQSHNALAGTTLAFHVPEKETSRSFVLLGPDGSKRRLGLPEVIQGRPVLNIDQLPLAGIYRLVSTDSAGASVELLDDPALQEDLKRGRAKVGQPLAVTPDLRDTADLQQLASEQIDQRLGFKVTHVVAGNDPSSLSPVERTNREWTRWLLIAVLVLAVGETLLAWFCGRAW